MKKYLIGLRLNTTKVSSVVTEPAMYSKSQFYDLEVMCRQRAAVARKEMEYWLNEAEEWTRVSSMAATGLALRGAAPGKENRCVRPFSPDW